VLARYDSIGPLYTLPLPTSRTVPYAMATATSSAICHHRLVTPTPMSSPSCRVAQLSPALGEEMIPCVMLASLVDTSGYPFLAPILM
jgi:hypothetical protein